MDHGADAQWGQHSAPPSATTTTSSGTDNGPAYGHIESRSQLICHHYTNVAKCRVAEQLNLVAAANVARCTMHVAQACRLGSACDRGKIYFC